MSEIRRTGSEDQCGFGHLIDQEDDNLIYCRGCEGHLGQEDALTPDIAKPFNGWWWCLDCYHALEPVMADLERSHRMDEDRDDFEQVRR